MQYIQLQGQDANSVGLPLDGSYNLFIDVSDNSIKAKDVDGHMHGGGGLSLTEITREEIQTLVDTANLTPGAIYKITNAASRSFLDTNSIGYYNWNNGTYSGGGNEIQDGGTTVILQATTDKTLSKRGIGLFYVPNYENPSFPTLPPDTNYKTWDKFHRIYLTNITGRFQNGEPILLTSMETSATATGYLQGSCYNSGSNGAITFQLVNGDSHFFDTADNLLGLIIDGENAGANAGFDGIDYTSSYNPGDCVIYGGRVWQNLSGSIGYSDGGWPDEELYLNPEDWELVPFDEVHYTIQAHTIEYEFEYDNISYRNDGVNEVFSDWKWWDNAWGYNMIKFFPWGHTQIERVSFSNSYLNHFVNFPHDSYAWNIKFEDEGGFNAHSWGHQSGFYDIQGDKGAHFTGHDFGRGTDIYNIKLGINSYMSGINTNDNGNQEWSQIYEVTLANNAYFGDFTMYWGSYIEYVEIGTEANYQSFTMYEYSRIRNVNLDINSYFGEYTLWNEAEIKYVKIGINSWIEYFDLYYSSCLKRTTIGSDAWIYNFEVGINSFIRQVNLSERAYIENFTIGDYSNLQNIDLGAYSYMHDFNGGYSTDFQNIRLDASAGVWGIQLGYDGGFSEIQIAPNSSLYNIYAGGYSGGFTSSYISGITIEPHSVIGSIALGSYSSFQNIYLGTDVGVGNITLEESSNMGDINVMGDTEFGSILIASGSEITNLQLGFNAGIGQLIITGSATLNNFEIGNGQGFSDMTIDSSISNVTMNRTLNNFQVNTPIMGTTGSLSWADSKTSLDGNKSFYILNTTDWDASATGLNYYLPDGTFDGQTAKFFHTNGGTNLGGNYIGNLTIWLHMTDATNFDSAGDYPWYPFVDQNGTPRVDIPTTIWLDGKWIIDNSVYN